MRPTDHIEKLLSETPVPRVQNGLHRAALLQKLLAQMQIEERPMAEEPRQNGGDLSLGTRTKLRRRIMQPQWIAAAAVVAVATAIFVVKLTTDRAVVARPAPVHVAAPVSSDTEEGIAVLPPPTSRESLNERRIELLREKPLEQSVAEAQVIVVATALDSAPAPPKRPGDLAENFIRFQVTRVLKGNLDNQVITTRTPTAAAEFIGHEWVVMLSPEYMAGKHPFAGCYSIKVEPEVKTILSKAAK